MSTLDFPYEEVYFLESADVDHTQTLRPTTINRLLQEIAWKHATKLGVGYDQTDFQDLYWVLVRLDFQITGDLPKWADQIRIKTRPAGFDKLYAYREFQLLRSTRTEDDRIEEKEFCRTTSTWVIIDQINRKLQKPDGFLSKLPSSPPRLIEQRAPKLPRFQGIQPTQTISVHPGYNEVDLHHHVNNVVYLQWFLQTIDKQIIEHWSYSRVVLNFTEESFWGDALDISSTYGTSTDCDSVSQESLGPLTQIKLEQLAVQSSNKLLICSYHQAQHQPPKSTTACIGKIYWKPRTLQEVEKEATLHQHAHQ
jgi:medium-chain acyl-[acyl-carrier-protein] hydrolase